MSATRRRWRASSTVRGPGGGGRPALAGCRREQRAPACVLWPALPQRPSQPCHTPLQSPNKTDYKSYPVFVAKIHSLAARYGGIRRVRSDGNCFFRAAAFGLLEWLLVNEADAECQR
jgi:hypothetical protein